MEKPQLVPQTAPPPAPPAPLCWLIWGNSALYVGYCSCLWFSLNTKLQHVRGNINLLSFGLRHICFSCLLFALHFFLSIQWAFEIFILCARQPLMMSSCCYCADLWLFQTTWLSKPGKCDVVTDSMAALDLLDCSDSRGNLGWFAAWILLCDRGFVANIKVPPGLDAKIHSINSPQHTSTNH